MKINIIIPFTSLTGGIRVAFLYGNYFVSQGYDVKFYVPIIPYKFTSTKKRIKAAIKGIIKEKKVDWFECNFEIKRVPIINNVFIRDADVSIATAWPTAYDLEKLNESKGKKIYFVQDYEIWSGDKNKVDESYRLELNKIVISKKLNKLLKDKFNVESTIIYNGLNSKEYLHEKKMKNKKKNILMLYNNSPNKGSKEGIEILKNIKNKYNVNIILFGYKGNKDIPNDFKFYENPKRDKLLELYRKSDVYVFTSKQEAWGLPVMEAMANRCAIVGNNVGCVEEICTNHINAIIIQNLDYCQMQKEIEYLLENEELLFKLQNNGYELANKFSWSNSYKKFEEYILNI